MYILRTAAAITARYPHTPPPASCHIALANTSPLSSLSFSQRAAHPWHHCTSLGSPRPAVHKGWHTPLYQRTATILNIPISTAANTSITSTTHTWLKRTNYQATPCPNYFHYVGKEGRNLRRMGGYGGTLAKNLGKSRKPKSDQIRPITTWLITWQNAVWSDFLRKNSMYCGCICDHIEQKQ